MSKQNPNHYQVDGKVQLIDITKHTSFPVGSAMKYLFRAGNKPGESALDDLLKAKWFVELLIQDAIDAKAKAIVEADKQKEACEAAGEPLRACDGCPAKESCTVHKASQWAAQDAEELSGDDIAGYHTSVPEFIDKVGTRAGIKRRIL